MSDEVDFLHADKHQSFLQTDTIFFDKFGQAFPKYDISGFRNILIFGMFIDLLAMGILSFIC